MFTLGGKSLMTWQETRDWCFHNPGKKALIMTNEGGFELIFHPRRELPGSENFDQQRVELDQEDVRDPSDVGQMIADIIASDMGLKDYESKFIKETSERFEKYGERTLLSEKQLNWLISLHKKSQQ